MTADPTAGSASYPTTCRDVAGLLMLKGSPGMAGLRVVPPALDSANLSACVAGEIIVLPAAHAKVRRAGYVRSEAVGGRT